MTFCIFVIRYYVMLNDDKLWQFKRVKKTIKGNKAMSKNFDAYIAPDKAGLENKYVIIVDGKVVAKGRILRKCSIECGKSCGKGDFGE